MEGLRQHVIQLEEAGLVSVYIQVCRDMDATRRGVPPGSLPYPLIIRETLIEIEVTSL